MREPTTEGLTRRAFLGGSLATAGFVLAGCGSSASSSSSSGQPSASGKATSGGSGKTALRVAVPTDVLLSAVQRFNPSNRALRRTVFDPVIDKSPDGQYQPSVVSKWEWNADKTALVLTVRDGVTFHSGRAVGPDDIIYSIQTALKPGSGVQAAGLLKKASGIKSTGKNQVTVSFDSPFLGYLDALAILPVIDKDTYDNIKSGKAGQVVGTGPFTWASWTPGSKYELTKYGSYWQDGKPYLDHVSFNVITDSQAMLAAMRSGQLDLAKDMLARDAATLKGDQRFAIDLSAGYDSYVGISTQVKPLDDVRVRQAIAYALDRNRIASQVYQGFAEASCVPWLSSTPGVTKAQISHYSYDLDKAKALLKDANAVGATVEIAALPTDPTYAAIQQIVQYGLQQIGLKVKPVTLTAAEWPKRNQAHNLPGLFIALVGFTTSGLVPTLLAAAPLTPKANTSNFTTPEYQSLVKGVIDAPSKDAEAKATGALTDYMLEQAFHNTVVQAKSPVATVAGLTGAQQDLTLSLVLTDAKFAS